VPKTTTSRRVTASKLKGRVPKSKPARGATGVRVPKPGVALVTRKAQGRIRKTGGGGPGGDGGGVPLPPSLDPKKASPYRMTAAGSVTADLNQYLNAVYRTAGIDYNQTGACGYGEQECIGKPDAMLNPFGAAAAGGEAFAAPQAASPAGASTSGGAGGDRLLQQRLGVALPSRFGTSAKPGTMLTEEAMRANVLLTTTEAVRALWTLAEAELKQLRQPKGGRLTLRATTTRTPAGQSLRFFVCTTGS